MYLFNYLFPTEPTLYVHFVCHWFHSVDIFLNRFFIIAKCPVDEEDEGTADFQWDVFFRSGLAVADEVVTRVDILAFTAMQ